MTKRRGGSSCNSGSGSGPPSVVKAAKCRGGRHGRGESWPRVSAHLSSSTAGSISRSIAISKVSLQPPGSEQVTSSWRRGMPLSDTVIAWICRAERVGQGASAQGRGVGSRPGSTGSRRRGWQRPGAVSLGGSSYLCALVGCLKGGRKQGPKVQVGGELLEPALGVAVGIRGGGGQLQHKRRDGG